MEPFDLSCNKQTVLSIGCGLSDWLVYPHCSITDLLLETFVINLLRKVTHSILQSRSPKKYVLYSGLSEGTHNLATLRCYLLHLASLGCS